MARRRRRSLTGIILIALVVVGAIAWQAGWFGSSAPTGAPTPQLPPSVSPVTIVPHAPGAKCHMRGPLPDPVCTPGAIDPAVTQANIQQTICKSGYSATIRPPSSYTNQLKSEQMGEYGFTDDIKTHEEDHLISLELGGAPKDPRNLWPEPQNSPNPKDTVENALKRAVCDGRITLADAQHRIATNWVTARDGL